MRNQISSQLFARDLFDYQLPINDDLFFFGREQTVADHLDAIQRSQNRGLFGLRKTGKTSILYKLKREVERSQSGAFLYYDCKLPSIRSLNWTQLLKRVTLDIAAAHQIQVDGKLSESKVTESFIRTLERTPVDKVTALVFDEVEYISPLAVHDMHWHHDFVPFWQTLWAAQSQIRRLSNTIAGVNPTIVETDVFAGVQNPVFGIVQSRYLRGLELSEMRGMVRFFGKRMGLSFTEDAFEYLHRRYGGHPLLTRLACSQINADITVNGEKRPVALDSKRLRTQEDARDAELIFYCRHVVSELRQFYPNEYEMLEMLAAGEKNAFIEFSAEPEYVRHLKAYGLIAVSASGNPEIAIPVVGRYVATELARREGRRLRRRVIPELERTTWLAKRTDILVREIRELERLIATLSLPTLFGEGGFPEAERFKGVMVASTQDQFVTFVNICNRCLVESTEKVGKRRSDSQYFWQTIKNTYPDLWDALQRIKVYRHNALHLELNATTEAELTRYLAEDLEGRRPSEIQDVWFLLQQCTLDALWIGVHCEINRHT